MTTYTVTHLASGTSESGLSQQDAILHIYCDDGQGVRIEERIEFVVDDDGNETDATQQVRDHFGLEWNVYFTKAGNLHGTLSRLTAYGDTEELALKEFCETAFRQTAYDEYKWMIQSDEDFAKSQADAEVEASE